MWLSWQVSVPAICRLSIVIFLVSLSISSSVAEPKSSSSASASPPSSSGSDRRSYSSYESRDTRDEGYSSGGRSNRYHESSGPDDSDDGYSSQPQPKSKKTVILAIPVKLALQQAERERQSALSSPNPGPSSYGAYWVINEWNGLGPILSPSKHFLPSLGPFWHNHQRTSSRDLSHSPIMCHGKRWSSSLMKYYDSVWRWQRIK